MTLLKTPFYHSLKKYPNFVRWMISPNISLWASLDVIYIQGNLERFNFFFNFFLSLFRMQRLAFSKATNHNFLRGDLKNRLVPRHLLGRWEKKFFTLFVSLFRSEPRQTYSIVELPFLSKWVKKWIMSKIIFTHWLIIEYWVKFINIFSLFVSGRPTF